MSASEATVRLHSSVSYAEGRVLTGRSHRAEPAHCTDRSLAGKAGMFLPTSANTDCHFQSD